ncbi:alternative ribosome rescue factor ArfA [Bacillus bombysepticus]
MKNKTNNKKSIGEMSNSRMTWGFNSGTRVTKNKKGKGSYSRKNAKHE